MKGLTMIGDVIYIMIQLTAFCITKLVLVCVLRIVLGFLFVPRVLLPCSSLQSLGGSPFTVQYTLQVKDLTTSNFSHICPSIWVNRKTNHFWRDKLYRPRWKLWTKLVSQENWQCLAACEVQNTYCTLWLLWVLLKCDDWPVAKQPVCMVWLG